MKTRCLVDRAVGPEFSLSASCDVRLDVEEAELGRGLTESLLVSGGEVFVRTCEMKRIQISTNAIIIHVLYTIFYLCEECGVSGK